MRLEHLDEKNFDEFVKSDQVILIDLWATWCGPCRMLAPELEKLVSDGICSVGKVDVDENEDIAVKFGVESIPTLLLFTNGVLKAKSVGYLPFEKLKEFINSNI